MKFAEKNLSKRGFSIWRYINFRDNLAEYIYYINYFFSPLVLHALGEDKKLFTN